MFSDPKSSSKSLLDTEIETFFDFRSWAGHVEGACQGTSGEMRLLEVEEDGRGPHQSWLRRGSYTTLAGCSIVKVLHILILWPVGIYWAVQVLNGMGYV